MTIASEAVLGVAWPDGIPRNNNELYIQYQGFVAAALRKHNKVGRNFEELHAYIWKRLIEKDVIRLYLQSVEEKLPRQLTADQACAFLGVSFDQWKVKMWRFHTGVPIYSKFEPKRIIGRRIRGWMPTPINADEFTAECQKRNEALVAAGKEPQPVTNGHRSRKAIFQTEDIVKLLEMMDEDEAPFAKQGAIQPPQVKATKAHFQAYLSKSVFSDFANWCRTYARKWSQDRPMYHREGDDNDDANWQDKLIAPGGARQETQAVLKQACVRLSQTLYENMKGADTLKCKPVEQTEMQMYELLEQGVPLPETLRKLDVPERVRRAVLKSVADFRGRAA